MQVSGRDCNSRGRGYAANATFAAGNAATAPPNTIPTSSTGNSALPSSAHKFGANTIASQLGATMFVLQAAPSLRVWISTVDPRAVPAHPWAFRSKHNTAGSDMASPHRPAGQSVPDTVAYAIRLDLSENRRT